MKPERFYDLVVEVAIIRPGPIVGQMVHPYLEPPRRPRAGAPIAHPVARADPAAHARRAALPGAAAAHRDGGGRLHRRRGRGAAPRDGLQALGGAHARDRGAAARRHDARAASPAPRRTRSCSSITSFALYGFPESHAASFALIAYASAYSEGAPPGGVLLRAAQRLADGLLPPGDAGEGRRSATACAFLPIDVTRSDWRCTHRGRATVRARPALRRRGCARSARRAPRRRAALRVARPISRGAPSSSATSSRRSPTRARSPAFGLARREALWQVAARRARSRRRCSPASGRRVRDAPLPAMTPFEETAADYATTSLTTGPHVMTHLRDRLRARGVLAAARAARASRDGAAVRVAGPRDRPPAPRHREGHVLPHARGRDRHRERVPHAAALRALARAAEHVAAASRCTGCSSTATA